MTVMQLFFSFGNAMRRTKDASRVEILSYTQFKYIHILTVRVIIYSQFTCTSLAILLYFPVDNTRVIYRKIRYFFYTQDRNTTLHYKSLNLDADTLNIQVLW
jgi:hypothetical protein